MIYFDNAATTEKKPLEVKKAVMSALNNYSANPGRSGHLLSNETASRVYKCREKVGLFFNADAENVIFTANCTAAINFVIKGVLKEGDHAIISSLEHNAVARPIYKFYKDGIIEYDVCPIIMGDREATLRSLKRLIKENTKLVVFTHASNVTGEIMPIYEIGKLCHQHGILFCVDAAQTAGVLPIDVKDNIDFLCIAAHKGLYAPMGTGILIAEKAIENTIIEGGTGSFSSVLEQPLDTPERLESGTVNVPGIFGISAGIDFIKTRKTEAIYEHELRLIRKIYDDFVNMENVILYADCPIIKKYVPVLSFNIKNRTSTEVAEYLSKQGIAVRAGLHCAPLAHKTVGTIDTGTVRISTSAFNTSEEVRIFVSKIYKFAKEM